VFVANGVELLAGELWGVIRHCCLLRVVRVETCYHIGFYSLLSRCRQPVFQGFGRIAETRVDSCHNTGNTLFSGGKRKSRALVEQPRKPKNDPRVNRGAKRLERNPWGNFGRQCNGAFPPRRDRAESAKSRATRRIHGAPTGEHHVSTTIIARPTTDCYECSACR
jgi:hypothetical protein